MILILKSYKKKKILKSCYFETVSLSGTDVFEEGKSPKANTIKI